jgi:hypothetical protein
MKNLKLPKKEITMLYRLKGLNLISAETTITSQSDPTNICTTVLTTTHFIPATAQL